MNRASKATFAVGIFEACDALRKALADLISLGYQQRHLILLRPTEADKLQQSAQVADNPVGRMVVLLPGHVTSEPGQLQLESQANAEADNQDVALVRKAESWLGPKYYEVVVNAIGNNHKVLFVRMHEQRQIAPTCSILLTHCTQHVNTHEVPVATRH